MQQKIHLNVNREVRELKVDLSRTLLEVLRDDLGLTGTKYGCGNGECGSLHRTCGREAGLLLPDPGGVG